MTSSTQTVSAITSPSGYIMSHNTFNIQYAKNYDNNKHYKLNLTDIKGATGIHVEFIFMGIGPSKMCKNSSGDLFKLNEIGHGTYNQLYYCYDSQAIPSPLNLSINSSATHLLFELEIMNNYKYPGVFLKYTS